MERTYINGVDIKKCLKNEHVSVTIKKKVRYLNQIKKNS